MFGVQGVYAGERMLTLQIEGELYLKTQDSTVAAFCSAGSHPFVYENGGRTVQTSYWRLPDAAIDDPEEAAQWGRLALRAAAHAAVTRKPKRPKRRQESRR
jgi:DNA transformation protein